MQLPPGHVSASGLAAQDVTLTAKLRPNDMCADRDLRDRHHAPRYIPAMLVQS